MGDLIKPQWRRRGCMTPESGGAIASCILLYVSFGVMYMQDFGLFSPFLPSLGDFLITTGALGVYSFPLVGGLASLFFFQKPPLGKKASLRLNGMGWAEFFLSPLICLYLFLCLGGFFTAAYIFITYKLGLFFGLLPIAPSMIRGLAGIVALLFVTIYLSDRVWDWIQESF